MRHVIVTLSYKVREKVMVYYFTGLSVVHSWLLYKRHALQNQAKKIDSMSLPDLRSQIALSLLQKNKVAAKRGRPRSDNTPTVQKKSKSNLTFFHLTKV